MGRRWSEVGRCGAMWGWDPKVVVLQWRQISDVGRSGLWGGDGAMWGDVGLGPQSGRLIMEADKGCGVEVVVGQRWGDVGRCGAEVG